MAGIFSDLYTMTDESLYAPKTNNLTDLQSKIIKQNDRSINKQFRSGQAPTPNNLSAIQLQQMLSDAIDQQVYTAEDGSLYQSTIGSNAEEVRTPYDNLNRYGTADVRDLYIDNTAENAMKLGLARTDQGGFEGRYNPLIHPTWDKLADGELVGPKGVTREDGALMNITLPYDVATQLEYDVHNNIGQMENRAIGLGAVTQQDLLDYGGGKTEYTTQNAPIWNQDYVEGAGLTPDTPLPKNPNDYNAQYYNADGSLTERLNESKPLGTIEERLAALYGEPEGQKAGRLENLVDATQYGIGRTASGISDAFVDTATWMVKAGYRGVTGADEIEATKWINDNASLFQRDEKGDFVGLDDYGEAKEYGYDNSRTAESTEQLGRAFKSGNYSDMVAAVGEAITRSGPEFFLESAGEMLAVMAGGGAAKLAARSGVASTVGAYALSSGGSVALSTKYANEIMEERQKNLGDEPLSIGDRAFATATGGLVAMLNKLGADEILGNTRVIRSVTDLIAKPGGKTLAGQTLKVLASKTAEVAGKGTYEGLEEIAQEMVQKVGEKYGTDAQSELLSSETGKELFQAFGGGFAGGSTPAAASASVKAPFDILKAKPEAEIDSTELGVIGTINKEYDNQLLALDDLEQSEEDNAISIEKIEQQRAKALDRKTTTVVKKVDKDLDNYIQKQDATLTESEKLSLAMNDYTESEEFTTLHEDEKDIARTQMSKLSNSVQANKDKKDQTTINIINNTTPAVESIIDTENEVLKETLTEFDNNINSTLEAYKTSATDKETFDLIQPQSQEVLVSISQLAQDTITQLTEEDKAKNPAIVENINKTVETYVRNLSQFKTQTELADIIGNDEFDFTSQVRAVLGSSDASIDDIEAILAHAELEEDYRKALEVKRDVINTAEISRTNNPDKATKTASEVSQEKIVGGGKLLSIMEWMSVIDTAKPNSAINEVAVGNITRFVQGQQNKIDALVQAGKEYDTQTQTPIPVTYFDGYQDQTGLKYEGRTPGFIKQLQKEQEQLNTLLQDAQNLSSNKPIETTTSPGTEQATTDTEVIVTPEPVIEEAPIVPTLTEEMVHTALRTIEDANPKSTRNNIVNEYVASFNEISDTDKINLYNWASSFAWKIKPKKKKVVKKVDPKPAEEELNIPPIEDGDIEAEVVDETIVEDTAPPTEPALVKQTTKDTDFTLEQIDAATSISNDQKENQKNYITAMENVEYEKGTNIVEIHRLALESDPKYQMLEEQLENALDGKEDTLQAIQEAKAARKATGGQGKKDSTAKILKEYINRITDVQDEIVELERLVGTENYTDKELTNLESQLTLMKENSKKQLAIYNQANQNIETLNDAYTAKDEQMISVAFAYNELQEYKSIYTVGGQVLFGSEINSKKMVKPDKDMDAIRPGNYFNVKESSIDILNWKVKLNYSTDATGAVTPLNAIREGVVDAIMEALNKDGTQETHITESLKKGIDGFQNVIRMFASKNGKDAQFNELVTDAAMLGAMDWLITKAADNRALIRDDTNTKKLVGIKDDKGVMSSEQEAVVQNFDGSVTDAASAMGSQIMKTLGLKPKFTNEEDRVNNERVFKAMSIEFGLLGLLGLEKAGMLKLHNQPRDNSSQDSEFLPGFATPATLLYGENNGNEGQISTYSLTQSDKINTADQLEDEKFVLGKKNTANGVINSYGTRSVKAIQEALGDIQEETGPYFTQGANKTKKDDITIKGLSKKVGKTPDTHVKAVEAAEDTIHYMNERFMALYNKIKEAPNDYLKGMLGYQDPEVGFIHKFNKPSIIGKNRSIERDMENLEKTDATIEEKMWFKWYVGSNFRFYIDSSTFDAQAIKLHRFSTRTKKVDITKDSIEEDNFKIGVLQTLGYKVERRTRKTLLKEFDKKDSVAYKVKMLLENGDIEGALEVGLENHKGEPEHTMLGVAEYDAYLAHQLFNEGDTFQSALYTEADGTTNGYILKNLQMPIFKRDGQRDITRIFNVLEAGGIIKSIYNKVTGKDETPSFAQLHEQDDIVDAYNQAAKAAQKAFKEASQPEKFEYRYNEKRDGNKIKALEMFSKDFIKNVNNYLELLGETVTKEDIILEVSRTFMKDPFMIFNYGSALKTIVQNLANRATHGLYTQLEIASQKNAGNEVSATSEKAMQRFIESIKSAEYFVQVPSSITAFDKKVEYKAKVIADEVARFEDSFSNDPINVLDMEVNPEVAKALTVTIEKALFKPIETAFKAEYGEFIEATKTMNETMVLIAKLSLPKINQEIDKQIEEKLKEKYGNTIPVNAKERQLTSKEIDNIIYELRDIFPILKAPLGDNKDNLLLASQEIGDYDVDAEYTMAETTGFRDMKAKSPFYRLIESYTTGAVIPIHMNDSTIMASVMAEIADMMGVHDGGFFNSRDIKAGATELNRATIDIAKAWSMTTEFMNSLNATLNKMTQEDVNRVNEEYFKEYFTGGLKTTIQTVYPSIGRIEQIELFTEIKNLVPELYRGNAINGLSREVEKIISTHARALSLSDSVQKNVQSQYQSMQGLQIDSELGREEIFNVDLQVEQYAYEGGDYKSKAGYTKQVPILLTSDIIGNENIVDNFLTTFKSEYVNASAGQKTKMMQVLRKVTKDTTKQLPGLLKIIEEGCK